MKKCTHCGVSIILFGKKKGHNFYCSEECKSYDYQINLARTMPNEIIEEEANLTHKGACPKCGSTTNGPVDIQTYYTICSLIIMSEYFKKSQLSCWKCGVKKKIFASISCGLFGWWSLIGIGLTPVQIGKNILTAFQKPDPDQPSDELKQQIRLGMAAYQLQRGTANMEDVIS